MLVSIGEASNILGVSICTLRRWDALEKLPAKTRTKGGHRRYDMADLQRFMGNISLNDHGLTIAYARVSSHDQKSDLERQKERLSGHCLAQGWQPTVISDLGSGLKIEKKGLTRVLLLLLSGKVKRLVLTHADRLLRFGAALIFQICMFFHVEVIVLEEPKEIDFQSQLVQDLIAIITVFSAKLYGKRSHTTRTKKRHQDAEDATRHQSSIVCIAA